MDKFNEDQVRMTAAVDRVLQSFTCSNGNHRARGEPVIVNKRKLCSACAEARNAVLKGRKKPIANTGAREVA